MKDICRERFQRRTLSLASCRPAISIGLPSASLRGHAPVEPMAFLKARKSAPVGRREMKGCSTQTTIRVSGLGRLTPSLVSTSISSVSLRSLWQSRSSQSWLGIDNQAWSCLPLVHRACIGPLISGSGSRIESLMYRIWKYRLRQHWTQTSTIQETLPRSRSSTSQLTCTRVSFRLSTGPLTQHRCQSHSK